jgi:hypothetical protein
MNLSIFFGSQLFHIRQEEYSPYGLDHFPTLDGTEEKKPAFGKRHVSAQMSDVGSLLD